MGIGSRIPEIAQARPNKTAIIYQDQCICYQEFYYQVCQHKQGIQALTGDKKPNVAILIGNEPSFLTLFFAIISLGGTAIPFDPKWSYQEAVYAMEELDLDLVVTNKRFSEMTNYHVQATTIEEIKAQASTYSLNDWESTSLDDSFYLGFTSGSTGRPKGFIRNHQSWLASFSAAEQAFHYGADDTVLAPGPLCHSLSLFAAIHAIHIGATFYLMPRFIPEKVRTAISQGQVTVMFAVPSMLYRLVEQQTSFVEQPITFLSSGAKLNTELKSRLSHVFPNRSIHEYYGASELSFVTYTTESLSEHNPNSVGKAFPGVSISIRDETGELLQHGETGRIYVTSEFLFAGYIHHPAATADVLTKYGATVGDLGYLDKKGVLTVVGRENNMLISGGLNIYPEEVERVIKSFSAIHEAVVFGVEDAYWGQKVIALIQWKQHRLHTELQAYCKHHLASYKMPKLFKDVHEFFYTSSGKIDREKMIKLFK